jgi:hypothetical protein
MLLFAIYFICQCRVLTESGFRMNLFLPRGVSCANHEKFTKKDILLYYFYLWGSFFVEQFCSFLLYFHHIIFSRLQIVRYYSISLYPRYNLLLRVAALFNATAYETEDLRKIGPFPGCADQRLHFFLVCRDSTLLPGAQIPPCYFQN